jgi:hypothetical protein
LRASIFRKGLNAKAWQNTKGNVALCPEKESAVVPVASRRAVVRRQSASFSHNFLKLEEVPGPCPALILRDLIPPLLGKTLWKKWRNKRTHFSGPDKT